MEKNDRSKNGLRPLGGQQDLRRAESGDAPTRLRPHPGMDHKNEIIESVLPHKPFTYRQLDNYLGPTIHWDLTDEYLEGLKTFYHLAHQMNLIEHIPEIKLANVKR